MRVLTVGNMFPPHHAGGYELVWASAVDHLRARGHEVRVLTTDLDTGATQADGADVHRELRWHLRDGAFPQLGLRERTAIARHNHRVLARHVDAFAPDVMSWWSMGGLSLTLLEAVRRRGLPAVAFVHDEWLDYGRAADAWLDTFTGPRRRRLASPAERLAGVPAQVDLARAASYVFVSDFVRRQARGAGVRLGPTAVAHSGIHPDFLYPAPEVPWRWRLLCVGRLDPRKGVDVAVEALARLPPEAHLTITGGWSTREEGRLRALVARHGLAAQVAFTGQCDRAELLDAYAQADAVLFPVRWDEPWGLVPLEAMGRGRPVIATGRGGSAEYLQDGRNCLLVPTDDPAALAAAVQRLAPDRELRSRLREGGFATAARHTEPVFNAAVEAATLAVAAGEPVEDRAASAHGRPLRILHLGSGFRPLRHGGLVAYAEDLMAEQVRAGHDVSYLFSGRYLPLLKRPRLRRWRLGGVAMLEVINSPLYDHGAQPELEVAEPQTEAIVAAAIAELQPDVVHVQELAGLPSSVLDLPRRAGLPTVLTLQDYFPLCPAFKLLDGDGRLCLRRDVGADCVATIVRERRRPSLLYEATLRHQLLRRTPLRRLDAAKQERLAGLSDRVARRLGPPARPDPPASADAYQRRRDVNVERLNGTQRVLAMSQRVADLYEALGVDRRSMRTLRLTLGHIEHLRPRRSSVGRPLTFATLGAGESPAKGSRVLLDAARALERERDARQLRLLIFGAVTPEVTREAAGLAGVEVRGGYAPHELDALLDEVDVGIIPSVWEEAYGFAGVELLAKGIPVIGNAVGGIVDYVHDGETGWLNRPCSAEGLAAVMRHLAAHPEDVAAMSDKVRAARGSVVLRLADHAAALDAVYREAIAEVRAG